MSAGRSLLCRTTPRAQVARHGCATPGDLRASVQVRQSALLAAYPSIFVKAHSRGPAPSGSRDYSPSAAHMAAGLLAPPARRPEPAAPPGSKAPTAALGAYDEPEVEPDVSVTLSAAVRQRERLAAAALLVLRARSAGDRPGAVSRCSAERASIMAASPMARARWNTRVLSWMTWPCAVVCAAARAASAASAAAGSAALLCPAGPGSAAPARRARRLRMSLSRAAVMLAMQDLPQGAKSSEQSRQGFTSLSQCHTMQPIAQSFFAFDWLPSIWCYNFSRSERAILSLQCSDPLGMCMRADSCLFTATLIELSVAACYTERMTCCLPKQVRQSWR